MTTLEQLWRSRWQRTFTCVLLSISLTLSGCAEVVVETVKHVFTAAAVATVVAVAVTKVQEARAATLDVERKQLEIEAIKGNSIESVSVSLSESEMIDIQNSKQVKLKLQNGSTTVIPVTVRQPSYGGEVHRR